MAEALRPELEKRVLSGEVSAEAAAREIMAACGLL